MFITVGENEKKLSHTALLKDIPQDSVAVHKSKLHLIFQGRFSRSQYKFAILLTATRGRNIT